MLLSKGKSLSGNKQHLAEEFCVVAGKFSNLQCLMNTLITTVQIIAIINIFIQC